MNSLKVANRILESELFLCPSGRMFLASWQDLLRFPGGRFLWEPIRQVVSSTTAL